MQEQRVISYKKVMPPAGGRPTIPVPPTALIGRERELAFAQQILADPRSRLLTLTGPGGVGKTRLSLEIAHHLADSFADGVAFVSLAPVNDPTLVVASIAAALGLREDSSSSLIERLKNALRDRHRLLVLDNFEQVIAAAPLVVELLSAAPQVRVIVSSRAPLRVRGERELPLAPLGLPDARQPLHLDDPAEPHGAIADSMSLFVQAASAVDPNFELNEENAATIAEICIKLDGLPLAIELAAARVRLLSVGNILSRLGNRLGLLTGGARDLPARQQTLRNAIAWSYDLLEESERKVFRRLASFSGGCTLEAAEEICRLDDEVAIDLFNVLGSLLEKSMLYRTEDEHGEYRFSMLGTVLDFAAEMLESSGEEALFRGRHAAFFLRFAQRSTNELLRGDQKLWLRMLEADHDNFRAALRWLLEQHEMETVAALGSSLVRFWLIHGYPTEGREWLEKILESGGDLQERTRIELLNQLATLAWSQGDLAVAREILEQGLQYAEELGDRRQIQIALNLLGNVAHEAGDLHRSAEMHRRSLELRREEGNPERIATALINLANTKFSLGDFEEAREMYQESLAINRKQGTNEAVMLCTMNIGYVEYALGNYARAEVLLQEAHKLLEEYPDKRGRISLYVDLSRLKSETGHFEESLAYLHEVLPIAEELQDIGRIGFVYSNLAHAYLVQGEPLKALEYYRQSLIRHYERGYHHEAADSLFNVAVAAHALGWTTEPVLLAAAAGKLSPLLYKGLPKADKGRIARTGESLALKIGQEAYRKLEEQGTAMTLTQAVEMAQNLISSALNGIAPEAASLPEPAPREEAAAPSKPGTLPPPPYPADLTLREAEVLNLVAQGLTDAEVGEKLFISTRTVNAHLRSVYSKLGITSRGAATEFAQANGLA